ncbi:MAG: hypothetical protein E7603_09855 [Ruminococcaceae bacterium]|nr:hypothetical protein [Oscillospiraceae bacterium]
MLEKKYIIRRKLEQQTPIIHFQHDQKGATLRATEVKPKLDTFILSKTGTKKAEDCGWFIKDTKALNYKLRFFIENYNENNVKISKSGDLDIEAQKLELNGESNRAKAIRDQAKNEINAMYFANMVSSKKNGVLVDLDEYASDVKKQYKETVFYSKKSPIIMEIICFIPTLRDAIEKHLEEFFIVHNFGSRQSKGFGGFKLLPKDNEKGRSALEILQENGYQFFYAACRTNDVSALMNHAMIVYAILKGGLNMTGWDKNHYKTPNNYIKGYIQRRFISDAFENGDQIGGDKAYIKRYKRVPHNFIIHENRKHSDSENQYSEYKFMRILLGMADHYEFHHIHQGNVNVYSLGETGYDVQRFRSPITIKILEGKIFFVFDVRSLQLIAGKRFYFLLNKREQQELLGLNQYAQQKAYIQQKGISIQVPEIGSAEMKILIEKFIKYFNAEKTKLRNFAPRYQNTANIILQRGNINE